MRTSPCLNSSIAPLLGNTPPARTVAGDEELLAGRQVDGRLLGVDALPGPGGARVHQVVPRTHKLLGRQLLQGRIVSQGQRSEGYGRVGGGGKRRQAAGVACRVPMPLFTARDPTTKLGVGAGARARGARALATRAGHQGALESSGRSQGDPHPILFEAASGLGRQHRLGGRLVDAVHKGAHPGPPRPHKTDHKTPQDRSNPAATPHHSRTALPPQPWRRQRCNPSGATPAVPALVLPCPTPARCSGFRIITCNGIACQGGTPGGPSALRPAAAAGTHRHAPPRRRRLGAAAPYGLSAAPQAAPPSQPTGGCSSSSGGGLLGRHAHNLLRGPLQLLARGGGGGGGLGGVVAVHLRSAWAVAAVGLADRQQGSSSGGVWPASASCLPWSPPPACTEAAHNGVAVERLQYQQTQQASPLPSRTSMSLLMSNLGARSSFTLRTKVFCGVGAGRGRKGWAVRFLRGVVLATWTACGRACTAAAAELVAGSAAAAALLLHSTSRAAVARHKHDTGCPRTCSG